MLEEEELKSAVLMILANKQDLPGCLSVAEVHKALGLEVTKSTRCNLSMVLGAEE